MNFFNRFTLAFWRFKLSKLCGVLQDVTLPCVSKCWNPQELYMERRTFDSSFARKSAFCFLSARPLIMRSSWPFFYNHSILVGKPINKSKPIVKTNTNEISRASRSTVITVTMVFLDMKCAKPVRQIHLRRISWMAHFKEGARLWPWRFDKFLFVFLVILFDSVCPTCKHSGLCRFRVPFNADFGLRTSPLSLIEKAMVAGDPKAHECHEYHFKAFPNRSQFPLPVSLRSKYWSPGWCWLKSACLKKKIKFFRAVNWWRFESL